jgi:hypothetical protein
MANSWIQNAVIEREYWNYLREHELIAEQRGQILGITSLNRLVADNQITASTQKTKPKKKFESYYVDLPRLTAVNVQGLGASDLAEYATVAEELGFAPTDLLIEQFKTFLADQDIPVFALSEVVPYMDKKAACESKDQAGWEWRPLRTVDERDMTFGEKSKRVHYIDLKVDEIKTASDRYKKGEQKVYDKVVPLHALKKVQMIMRVFGDKIAFFVADYAPSPKIEYADPFLMAVVPNAEVASGKGRFVIDFWDEPNFGIEKMLKTA